MDFGSFWHKWSVLILGYDYSDKGLLSCQRSVRDIRGSGNSISEASKVGNIALFWRDLSRDFDRSRGARAN